MGNDLKYGLVLGAVLILIFIGYLAMRTPAQDAAFSTAVEEQPEPIEPNMFDPPRVAEPPRRRPTAQLEISTEPEQPEVSVAPPPILPGWEEEDIPDVPPVDHVTTDIEDPGPAEPRRITYTIRERDVLTSISQEFYGTTRRWREIHEANRDVIPDPDRLTPGTTIIIPDLTTPTSPAEAPRERAEPAAPAAEAPRTHTVASGDTLYSLAARYYNDGNQWQKIYAANESRIPNPDVLTVGVELIIP